MFTILCFQDTVRLKKTKPKSAIPSDNAVVVNIRVIVLNCQIMQKLASHANVHNHEVKTATGIDICWQLWLDCQQMPILLTASHMANLDLVYFRSHCTVCEQTIELLNNIYYTKSFNTKHKGSWNSLLLPLCYYSYYYPGTVLSVRGVASSLQF